MKKRLKGLLVLWLAFLMVVSTPMTANAAVTNIILYNGTVPLIGNYAYRNNGEGDKFQELYTYDGNRLPQDQIASIFTENSKISINSLVEGKLIPQEGYAQDGWKLWNSTSGYSLSNYSDKKNTDYIIEVPAKDSDNYNTSDYVKYIAKDGLELLAIEPVWKKLDYKITHQPDNKNPYVEIGMDGVTGGELDGIVRKYEWYSAISTKVNRENVVSEMAKYDEVSEAWVANSINMDGVMSYEIDVSVSQLTTGDILQLVPTEKVEINVIDAEDSDGKTFTKDNSGVWSGTILKNRYNLRISSDSAFSIKINTIHGSLVDGQTTSTFSGYNGDYYCKVIFENGGWLKSNTFTYTRYPITANPSTNGSYSIQVGGQEVTKAIPGSEVTVVATADEGYELESISATPDGGDGNSIEFKDSTTFIMPDGPISVDVAFKKRTYGITLPTSQVGYSVNPVLVEGEQKTSVEHGDSFTFDVSIAEGYAAANNYAVKANDTTLKATSSKDNVYTYTIENITAEQEITVTGVEKTYPVAMSEAANGSVSVAAEDGSSTSGAVKGTILTITPTPAEGYELDTLTVIQKDGSDTAVTVDDKNQFTMPKYPVEVSVTFKKKTYGITLPQGQTGYTVTSSQTSPVEHGSDYTFKVTISDGYDVPTALSVKANGNALVATTVSGKEYTYTLEKVTSVQEITVEGVSDITGPEVTITLDAENTWKHFLFKIGFGLFFQEEKKLTIDAVDTGSGRGSVTYYVSETDLFPTEETYSAEEIEKRIPQWTEYSGAVFITVDRSYVVYAKATDIAGNVTYVSTSGMVIDTTKPVISGLEDGGQYYGDTATTISDANLSAVKLDGKAVEFTGTSASVTITADGAEHTIEATDKAGNQTAYKVTVSETWVRDGISSAGSRVLKLGVPYKFGTGKWKVAGDTTVYEGGNTFYASEGGTFEFQTQ